MVTFNLPGTIITGAGASEALPEQVRRLGARRTLIVTDRFLERQGLAARFARLLEGAGIAAGVFADVQPDPTDANVRAGLAALRASGAEALVGLGGGSAIDAAKAIAVMASNDEPLHQYMGYGKIPRAGLPLVAVPTTAGTGSEVTKAAVITDTARDVKMMMLDAHLLPVVALVDYELSMSMPRPLTAHVGVDTLTHGMEAYVSRKANGMADPYARSCVELCARHLCAAWDDGGDRAAREGMALAACHGGAAFANSSVCLVHGMSRPIGALFHLPHGLSNAVLLPAVTRFSLPGAPARYAEVARALGFAEPGASDEAAGAALAGGLAALNQRLEIPRLRDCPGMDAARFERSLEKMAGDALASGSPQNNPVVPTPEQIVALYREAW